MQYASARSAVSARDVVRHPSRGRNLRSSIRLAFTSWLYKCLPDHTQWRIQHPSSAVFLQAFHSKALCTCSGQYLKNRVPKSLWNSGRQSTSHSLLSIVTAQRAPMNHYGFQMVGFVAFSGYQVFQQQIRTEGPDDHSLRSAASRPLMQVSMNPLPLSVRRLLTCIQR